MAYRHALGFAIVLFDCVAAIDNGLGLTPPMGWRSWNAYGGNVDQSKMTGTMDRMTERTRMVDGKNTSLLDVGYNNAGLDDNWQQCGSLFGQRAFHAADGTPLINTKAFPSLSAMTMYGHARGLRVGWYMNNCLCAERGFSDPEIIQKIMEKSALAVGSYGFDGLKLDVRRPGSKRGSHIGACRSSPPPSRAHRRFTGLIPDVAVVLSVQQPHLVV